MKIALVHDQLQEFGGAERVFVTLKEIYPQADIFTSFYSPEKLGIHAGLFKNWKVHTSWAQNIPGFKRLISPLRFLTPLIWESFDFKGYDLVISSSGGHMCKGIITRPETTHICYLHHQPRYLYYYETAIEWQKYLPVKIYGHLINHDLRMWDYLSSQRVDYFIANSKETKSRIAKFYRRDAEVIYPPVDIPTDKYVGHTGSKPHLSDKYYVTVSRLARAKHIEILIEAANEAKFNLKIVGTGRDEAYLRNIAGPTVEFMGGISDEDFPLTVGNAEAFLFASVDDEFGIAPAEAMGYGLPVIAFASGGVPEVVDDDLNGFLYRELSPASLIEAVRKFEHLNESQMNTFRIEARRKAESFKKNVFKEKIENFVAHHKNARTS